MWFFTVKKQTYWAWRLLSSANKCGVLIPKLSVEHFSIILRSRVGGGCGEWTGRGMSGGDKKKLLLFFFPPGA